MIPQSKLRGINESAESGSVSFCLDPDSCPRLLLDPDPDQLPKKSKVGTV